MVSYLEPKRHLIQAFCHRCMNLLEASQSHFLHEKWDQILVLILHETKQAKNSVCVQINIKSSLKFFNSIRCKKVFKQRNHDQRAQFFYSLWFHGGRFPKKETKLKTKRKTVDFSDSSPSFLYLSNVSKSAHFSLLDNRVFYSKYSELAYMHQKENYAGSSTWIILLRSFILSNTSTWIILLRYFILSNTSSLCFVQILSMKLLSSHQLSIKIPF